MGAEEVENGWLCEIVRNLCVIVSLALGFCHMSGEESNHGESGPLMRAFPGSSEHNNTLNVEAAL